MGATASGWQHPPVRLGSLQGQGTAAAQQLSAVAGCSWLTRPSISRTSCSRPICNSRGSALATAVPIRFAAPQRFLPLPRHADVRRPRDKRLRASPPGYGLSALYNSSDGAGNPSCQFQPQHCRPAFAVCSCQVSDAAQARPGELIYMGAGIGFTRSP